MSRFIHLPYRRTIRLRGYYYSTAGGYFITITTKNHYPYFGYIDEGITHLSEAGLLIDRIWDEVPLHYKHISLDEYVIMPDHFHGIIFIGPSSDAIKPPSTDAINRVRTGGFAGDKNPMLNQASLSNIIRRFKGRCSYEIRRLNGNENFAWHSRFYESIIRNQDHLRRLRLYIMNNPVK